MPGPGFTLIVPEVFQCDALTQEWLLVNAFMVRPSGVTGLAAVCYVMDMRLPVRLQYFNIPVTPDTADPSNPVNMLKVCSMCGIRTVLYMCCLGLRMCTGFCGKFMVAFMSQPSADAMKA